MKREAVLHIPMSEYAHGIEETQYLFRIRTAKNDIKECNFYYGDTACRQNPILFTKQSMAVAASDEYFDYYEVEMEGPYHRIYYYFELNDGQESIYYYADFFRNELADDRSEYYKLPFNRREDIVHIPEWVRDAVIYNIFPDSFASGCRHICGEGRTEFFNGKVTRSRLGGTIRGIGDNADYLADLGINCIYINPVFAAGEYHKYDTIDYKTIDPCFGTNEEFREMVQILHSRGIRVIIDGVFNHCGWEHPAFEDVVEKGEKSPYWNWFYKLTFPVHKPADPEEIPGYECFAYERMMPKLNTSNKETAAALIEAGTYWVREYDIDGWRLDVASEVNDDFWREFRKAVKTVKPDSFIIGEVWESARHWLDGSQFDSTMNYDLRKFCTYFFADRQMDASQFSAGITSMLMRYRKSFLYAQLNLLDSHDVSRFYSVCKENIPVWKLAVLFQLFFIGIPSIFYGDEQQLAGIKEHDYRQAMQWSRTAPMYSFYKEAIAFRKGSHLFTRGTFKTLTAEPGSRLYGFARALDGESIHIYLHAGTGKASLPAYAQAPVWQENYSSGSLGDFGFAIFHPGTYT